MSASLSLNEKLEVRAMTRSCGTCASRFSSSSERPSEKYSCSWSELMLTNGSTAMELSLATTAAGAIGADGAATLAVSLACW